MADNLPGLGEPRQSIPERLVADAKRGAKVGARDWLSGAAECLEHCGVKLLGALLGGYRGRRVGETEVRLRVVLASEERKRQRCR